MHPFTFTILNSFKDRLSRQVAEAIEILYSKDELLNSKNEYNNNHLARVIVEEDAFKRKKKAKEEEMKEIMEKKKWEEFKSVRRKQPKRKQQEEGTIPMGWMNRPKRLRRMEGGKTSQFEDLDLQEWWGQAEEKCLRAWELVRILENGERRVLRMIYCWIMDLILKDGPEWRRMAKEWSEGAETIKAIDPVGPHPTSPLP